METTRNNRSIGEPLPAEQKRGKHRVKKDKNYCNRLKGAHLLTVDSTIGGFMKMSDGRQGGFFRWIITACTACGKKEWHHMDSPEQEEAFYMGNALVNRF